MRNRTLKYIFLASCTAICLLTIWLAFHTYTTLEKVEKDSEQLEVKQRQTRLTEMLLYFDEVLTQAVRNYVYTQDRSWLIKYDQALTNFESGLDSLQQEELSAKSHAIFNPKKAYAQTVIDYEKRVFSLVEAHEIDSAIQLVNNAEYGRYRRLYLETFVKLHQNQYLEFKQLQGTFKADESVLRRNVSLLIVFIVLGLIVLPIQGYLILRFIRRIHQANTRLSSTVRDLRTAKREIKEAQLHHQTFFETNQSGIFRIDFLKPMPIDLPMKDQFNWMVNHAYIGESNNQLAQMYGFQRKEDIIGKSLLIIWDDWETVQDIISFYLNNNYQWTNLETSEVNAEGEKKCFLSNTVSIIEAGRINCIWCSQIDITEKKKVENKLIESEANFRAIVTHSTPIVFMFDISGTILLSEGKMLSSLNLKPGELVGRSVFEIYQDYPEVMAAIKKTLKGEVYEGIIVLDDLTFEVYYSPNFDAQGKIIGVIGMALDITQRKKTELALKNSENNLASVLENTSDVILSIDHEYQVLTVNSAGKKQFRHLLGAEIHKGANLLKLIPARLQMHWKTRFDRALKGERFMEEDHFHYNDIEYFAEVYYNPIWDEKKVKGIAIFSLEITNRKKAERAMLESEQEKTNLLMALDEAALVSITDLEGNIKHVNAKYCEVSGYTLSELVGEKHHIMSSGFHDAIFWREMWDTLAQGKAWRGEVKNSTKQGSDYWMDTIISPIKKPNGEIYEYMSINYLITEHKHLFSQREELLKDLEDYAFQTSHKIRGPLARMLGLTNLLLSDQSYEEKELQDLLKMIRMTSEELDSIIIEMNETLSRTAYYKIKK
ncbi:MAG: PAS domain S-box protein [Flammeovirgaceae bacterium]